MAGEARAALGLRDSLQQQQLPEGAPAAQPGAREPQLAPLGMPREAIPAAAPSLAAMPRAGPWLRRPSAPLIPQPRGGRAQRAALVLLALGAAALCLAGEPLGPAARSIASHLLAPQLGALLRGTCFLAEEIFHLRARHQGSFRRALCACFPPRRPALTLLLCGSACAALLDADGRPLGLHLLLASLAQLLILALGLHTHSAVEISEMSERSKQNVAHGLAWSYYIGYLKIVLPRMKTSMEEFSRANPNMLTCRETWKLHILIPLSCDVCDDLEKADSNIKYLTDLTETTLTRAGTKKRVYKHSLYSIRDKDNKLWPCAVEYATPLQALQAMSQDPCAALSREERLEQARLFYRTLQDILKGSKECAGTYRLIAYEELGEAEPHSLSREILWHLWQQRHEEYPVQEGAQPQHPTSTFCSEELNLQISESDLPQPLRSDGF